LPEFERNPDPVLSSGRISDKKPIASRVLLFAEQVKDCEAKADHTSQSAAVIP
jgi:hypothetical protein